MLGRRAREGGGRYGAGMIVDDLTVDRSTFEDRTGWRLEPEGACKGEICVPLAEPVEGPTVQVDALADRLGLALVHDAEFGLWALGPETMGSRALATATAPNLTLPTLDGDRFELSSLRGSKVVLVAWSPY